MAAGYAKNGAATAFNRLDSQGAIGGSGGRARERDNRGATRAASAAKARQARMSSVGPAPTIVGIWALHRNLNRKRRGTVQRNGSHRVTAGSWLFSRLNTTLFRLYCVSSPWLLLSHAQPQRHPPTHKRSLTHEHHGTHAPPSRKCTDKLTRCAARTPTHSHQHTRHQHAWPKHNRHLHTWSSSYRKPRTTSWSELKDLLASPGPVAAAGAARIVARGL